MILLPAIDLIAGRCVRLAQGDFARETSYSDDPAAALADFAAQGARARRISSISTALAPASRASMTCSSRLARSGTRSRCRSRAGFAPPIRSRAMLDAGCRARRHRQSRADRPRRLRRHAQPASAPTASRSRSTSASRATRAIVATHGWERGSGSTLDDVLGDFPARPPPARHRHRPRRHARPAPIST